MFKRLCVLLVVSVGAMSLGIASPASSATSGLDLTNPPDGSTVKPGKVLFEGTYRSGPVVEQRVVYVVDVSGSTSGSGEDCNGDGTPNGDDFNGDRSPGTVLDCEIAGVLALNSSLRTNPVSTSVIAFGDNAVIADMSPGGDDDSSTRGDVDDDNNTVSDVADVATSLVGGGVLRFTERRSAGGGTDFSKPLDKVKSLMDSAPLPRDREVQYTVFFISDGEASMPNSQISDLAGYSRAGVLAPIVNTVSVGSRSAGCGTGSPLTAIAAGLRGTCTAAAPSELQATLGTTVTLGLDRIEVQFGTETVRATVDALGRWTAEVTATKSAAPVQYRVTAFKTDGTTEVKTGSVRVAGANVNYLALGDSYSSGNGLVPYFSKSVDPAGKICQRSDKASAYSVTLPKNLSDVRLNRTVRACGGAVSIDMVGRSQFPEAPPQITHLGSETDLVTLTIGGNDAGFSNVLEFCAKDAGFSDDCQNADYKRLNSGRKLTLDEFASLRLTLVESDLLDTYRQVRSKAPNATVLVADYPMLIDDNAPGACTEERMYSRGERDWIRDQQSDFTLRMQRLTGQAGVFFTSVADDFEGHEKCAGGEDWMYGFEASVKESGDDDEKCDVKQVKKGPFTYNQTYCIYGRSFHPRAEGTKAYGKAWSKLLQTESDNGGSVNRSGLPQNPAPIPVLAGASIPSASAAGTSSVVTANASVSVGDLTEAERDEIRGMTFDYASVQDLPYVQGEQRPAACGPDLRALPGQVIVTVGHGFKPGAEVTPTVVLNGSTMVFDAVTADAEGLVASEVLLPTDIGTGPMVAFELTGDGANGYERRLATMLENGALDTACIQASRTADQLSTDGSKLPAGADNGWVGVGVTTWNRTDAQAQAVEPTTANPSSNNETPPTTSVPVTPSVGDAGGPNPDSSVASETGQAKPLAFTGASTLLLLLGASGLLLVGLGLLGVRRRLGLSGNQ